MPEHRRPNGTSIFRLNAEEAATVRKPFLGTGGANSFMRHLQQILMPDGTITLTDSEVGRIFRYAAHAGGSGGYESRFRKAFGRHLAAPFVCEQRSLLVA
jgi:hypothetical protein